MSAPNLPPEWVEIRFRECVPVVGQLGRVDSVETWKPFRVMSAADWDRGILVVCDDAGQSKQIKLDANHRRADRITASAPAPAQSQSRSSHMSAKHTPGPWTTDHKDHDAPHQDIKIKAGNHHTICTVWIDDAPVRDFNAMQEANARLIAAAPELLETLEYLARRPTQSNQWLDEVLEVIAKATGQDAQA